MTAKTSERLAQVLHSVGLFDMEKKARADQYHDYLSDDPLCSITLSNELCEARDTAKDPIHAKMIDAIWKRHLNGEFDASKEESDDWAASPEGQAAFNSLVKGK